MINISIESCRSFVRVLFLAIVILTQPGIAGLMERTGGDYFLSEVSNRCGAQRLSRRCYRIVFKSKVRTGRFDRLILDSDHMSSHLEVGSEVRLSAEIAVDKGEVAEISQVVIFAKKPDGTPPVWLLSGKHKAGPGPAARYLEMHSLQSDFSIL